MIFPNLAHFSLNNFKHAYMAKKQHEDNAQVKPDLQHDSMEFTDTSSDDTAEFNDVPDEDEEPTADELDILEADAPDAQAMALNAVEADRQVDNDIYFDENDIDGEEYDDDQEEN